LRKMITKNNAELSCLRLKEARITSINLQKSIIR
jgi:hypothetical protein